MKFDFAIGNPPYQESRETTKDMPVYNDFMDETSLKNISCAKVYKQLGCFGKRPVGPVADRNLRLNCRSNWHRNPRSIYLGRSVLRQFNMLVHKEGYAVLVCDYIKYGINPMAGKDNAWYEASLLASIHGDLMH